MNNPHDLESRIGIIRNAKRKAPPQVARNASSVVSATFAVVMVAAVPAYATSGTLTVSKTRSGQGGTIRIPPGGPRIELRAVSAEQPGVAEDSSASQDASTLKVLTEALAFAEIVHRVMPIDEELDRSVERALRSRPARRPPRKLSAK